MLSRCFHDRNKKWILMVDYNMHNQNNFFRHKKKIMHLFLTFSRSMGEKKEFTVKLHV